MYHIDFQQVIKLLKKKTRRKMPEKTDKNALKMTVARNTKKYYCLLIEITDSSLYNKSFDRRYEK